MFVRQTARNVVQLTITVITALALFALIFGVATFVPAMFHLDLHYVPTLVVAVIAYLCIMQDIIRNYPPRYIARIREEIWGWVLCFATILTVLVIIIGIQNY